MAFLFGMICGAVMVTAACWIWAAVEPRGTRPPHRRDESPRGWEDTRNFLYYDGTVMPTNKEEHYE